jgi:hypothetical protein
MDDGHLLDGSHVHCTAKGEMVISKSEVIVANTLRSLGIEYTYETRLVMVDGTVRWPDFTVARPGRPPVYWEHLGMRDGRLGDAADRDGPPATGAAQHGGGVRLDSVHCGGRFRRNARTPSAASAWRPLHQKARRIRRGSPHRTSTRRKRQLPLNCS